MWAVSFYTAILITSLDLNTIKTASSSQSQQHISRWCSSHLKTICDCIVNRKVTLPPLNLWYINGALHLTWYNKGWVVVCAAFRGTSSCSGIIRIALEHRRHARTESPCKHVYRVPGLDPLFTFPVTGPTVYAQIDTDDHPSPMVEVLLRGTG